MRYRIPSKPTTYCDVRFRSQLEASWAVVFETLALNWLYEPETYRLSNGQLYVPDFVVELTVDGLLWIEVKPDGHRSEKFERFMGDNNAVGRPGAKRERGVRGAVLHNIPHPDYRPPEYTLIYGICDDLHGQCFIGENYRFCICELCGAIGFEFQGRSARIRCGCDKGGSDYRHTDYHDDLLEAYAAAYNEFKQTAQEVSLGGQ